TGNACGAASGSGNISTTVDLNSGAVATFTVSATVIASATGSVSNTASAAVPSGYFDPNTANNSKTISTPINARVDLVVDKSASPSPVNAGSGITYTVTVTNNGPSGVAGATVSDTFDATKLSGITWTCAVAPTAAGNACGAASGSGNISTTVDLNSGAVATFTVSATVIASATGSVSNTASAAVPSGYFDPNTANNSKTISTPINARVDLVVDKSASPSPVNA